MTENRRIFLNVVATYGRSLYGLVCGILTGRWVLMALGVEDYGLYGVVGGMTFFISFFNGILSSAIGRFYTFSVGQAKASASFDSGLRECQAWFNTAVSLYAIVPIVLLLIGYPLGLWIVKSFLSIPSVRMDACVWVFRFACISCFTSMLNVPFQAMYVAKQCIAELTVYNIVATTLNVCFLYFLATHPADWLVEYAAWTCGLAVVPQLVICIRATRIFSECRFHADMMFDWKRFRELGAFATWQTIGALCGLLRGQGMAVLLNKFHGARVNAAMAVAGTVNAQASSLATAMLGAFSPAITTAYGVGDFRRMRILAFGACKFSVLLSLLFMVPLVLELPEILKLWLKETPPYVCELTALMLLSNLIENFTYGHMVAVNASGNIALYHIVMGTISLMALPIALLWALLGGSPCTAAWSIIATQIGYTAMRVILARKIVGFPICPWAFKIVVPLVVAALLSLGLGYAPQMFMGESFLRICLTTAFCLFALLPLSWFFIMNGNEREFVRDRLSSLLRRKAG